jgi:hypothetical protein
MVGDAKEINDLYQLMKGLEEMRTPAVENGFGTAWLGCLVNALGKDWQEVSCRGEWMCLELIENTLTFQTETAWAPTTEVFDLIHEKYPTIDYYYYCEEEGCSVYETNDRNGEYYAYRYIVHLCSPDEEYMTEYFRTLTEALEWISEQTGRKVTSEEEVTKLDEELTAQDEDAYCYINEVQVV